MDLKLELCLLISAIWGLLNCSLYYKSLTILCSTLLLGWCFLLYTMKSKPKNQRKKKKKTLRTAPFSFALSWEKEGRLVCKEAPEIGAVLQRKVGKLSSLSQAARWASLTGMHTFALETELHLICCCCLVFACCLRAAQMLEWCVKAPLVANCSWSNHIRPWFTIASCPV